MQHGQSLFLGCHQLRIIGVNCSGNNHRIGIIHLTSIMAHIHHGALLRQMRGHVTSVQIGATYIITTFNQHIC